MPKLLVLFFGAESPAVTLAEAAADGARNVRFTEVDVRMGSGHPATAGRRHKTLGSLEELRHFDGIVIACEAVGETPADLESLFDALEREPRGSFANTVFGVTGGDNTILLGRVSRLGGIIVSEATGVADPEDRAKQLGARVATVIGWVRHALGHEHAAHSGHHH